MIAFQEAAKLQEIAATHNGTIAHGTDRLFVYFDRYDQLQKAAEAIKPHLNGHLELREEGLELHVIQKLKHPAVIFS